MKTTVAAAISIAGVLTAGSVAALVNSQVFDSAPTESGASAAVIPPPASVELSIPDVAAPRAAAPTTTTMAAPAAAPAPAATGMLTAFEVGDAGVVTLDVIDGRLVYVSAVASPGWTITAQSDDNAEDQAADADEVEVVFESATTRVAFEAHLVDGQIVPSVASSAIGTVTSGSPAPNASFSDDDDDDDSEYDDDSDDDSDDDDSDDDEDEDRDDDGDEDRDDD